MNENKNIYRTETMLLRLTKFEKEYIEKEAERLNVTKSEYMRRRALGLRIRSVYRKSRNKE